MHTDDMNDLVLVAIDRGEIPADPWDEINMFRAENVRLRALLRRWYKTRGLHNEGSLLDDTESAFLKYPRAKLDQP